uniref:Dynein heavy chain AAA 5 extension domain-containing protein n=1 Tax=Amphimedon queenslandica TaxID=400682 RepID=A0A1X7TTB6_AMPQE
MFGVQDPMFATLATVSCCGMVWFSEDVLTLDMVQRDYADLLSPLFALDGIIPHCLEHAATLDHIMDFTHLRALKSFFSMLHQMIRNIVSYNQSHPDFPMLSDQIETYVPCYLIFCLIWCFSRDEKMVYQEKMGDLIRGTTTIPLPPGTAPIIDFEVNIQGELVLWSNRVPKIEVETHKVVGLNFSSATTPELLLKTFDHYCEYKRTPNRVVMAPAQLGKWLVLFCDEMNLPDLDKYGTLRV